ncbi:hypothetical protein [Variovorax sp.]|jgi:uncharacterized protein YaaW (UPF0174 family)|uniref:hypothetical protein n=1 Tax=Variovorax sp. TaxID=1871043 RepID=UPI0037D9F2DD
MSTTPVLPADEALLELLRRADHSDLAALVVFVTDDGAGRLTLAAVVREVLLKAKDEQAFLDGELRLLVRELQLFGGNSLRNVARGGGVAYKQIVEDVLSHVSGEVAPKDESAAQVELRVLAAIVSRLWSEADLSGKQRIVESLGFEMASDLEQLLEAVRQGGAAAVGAASLADGFEKLSLRRVVDSVSRQVTSSVRKPSMGLLAAVASRALPLTAAAATTGWGAQQLAGEAYRITLPCVVRIASIRQKESMREKVADSTQSLIRSSPNAGFAVDGVGPGWHIGTTVDRPIVSASILPGSVWKAKARAVGRGQAAGIDRLAPILQAVPGLSAALEQNGAEYVRVVVNGPLAAAADGNGLRGWVHDGRRITEQARFYEDPKLQNLVNSAALFNIASAVVAQKHLADISERLEAIEKGVAAIHGFLKDARLAEVNGAIAYLRQVAGTVMTGGQTPSIRQKLEDFEASLTSIQHHLESDLRELRDGIQTMKDPGKLGTSGMAAALQSLQPKLLELIDQWKLCHAARMAACQLVSAFPGEEALVQVRQRVLAECAAAFLAEAGVVEQVRTAMRARTQEMSSIIESKSETYARQLSLERWETSSLQPVLQRARQEVSGADVLLSFQEQPEVVLALRMGSQDRLEAYHLDDGASEECA